MKKVKFVLSKVFYLLLMFMCLCTIVGCTSEEVNISIESSKNTISEGETISFIVDVTGSEDKTFTWNISHPDLLSIDINHNAILKTSVSEDTTITITVTSNADNSKTSSVDVVAKAPSKPVVTPPVEDIVIGLSGPSEIKSGKSITLTANVTGTNDKGVTWLISKGKEYATVNENGVVTALETEWDQNIQVTAISNKDKTVKATKNITIVGKPILTQDMLDEIGEDRISFEGYIQIDLYTSGVFEKLYQTYSTPVKTAMDGTNWFAEYQNGDTGTVMQMYYKNDNNIASQIGVSLMNEEEYFPMLDEMGEAVSWEDAGLYNSLKGLKISDFKFNEEIWRYEYVGENTKLPQRVVSSANPYDFITSSFSLIIEEGVVLGIHSQAAADYSIAPGYKAMQELFVTFNCGDKVDVPTISKYSHEDIHDDLSTAITNMQKLNSYTLDFKENSVALGVSQYENGFTEYITNDDCFFRPYDISYDLQGSPVKNYRENETYGFKKINDSLYNAYTEYNNSYEATRAYETDFSKCKPTFAFAAEIFREYYIDEVDGSITYYVDPLMSTVASTYYYGMGNDINLYGIFATSVDYMTGQTFKPYVVVKDGYIIEAGFYYFVGSIYGVVELKYSNFDTTTLPEGTNIEFAVRQVPTKWDQVNIEVSSGSSSTDDDVTTNALEYLITFYNDEHIGERLPFFGIPLGDTYGFGLTTMHLPSGQNVMKEAIVFYYDVPLDIDYTINASLKAVDNYLVECGFELNKNGWYQKDDICIAPTDSSLDLMIYIWKA